MQTFLANLLIGGMVSLAHGCHAMAHPCSGCCQTLCLHSLRLTRARAAPQWAEFAAGNKGSSYKLHIFIEWSKPGAALPSADASPLTAKASAAGGGGGGGAALDVEKVSGISIRTHQSSGEGTAAPRPGAQG